MSNSKTTFSSLLVCDHIREEKSNKLIFVGVYPGQFILNKYPSNIALCLWLTGRSSLDEVVVEIRISSSASTSQNEVVFQSEPLNAEVNKFGSLNEGEFFIALQNVVIPLTKDGKVTFQARTVGGRWKIIAVKDVELLGNKKRK